jgi:hypothetical protein
LLPFATGYYLALYKDAKTRIAAVRWGQGAGAGIEGYLLPYFVVFIFNTTLHDTRLVDNSPLGTLPAPDRGLAPELPPAVRFLGWGM